MSPRSRAAASRGTQAARKLDDDLRLSALASPFPPPAPEGHDELSEEGTGVRARPAVNEHEGEVSEIALVPQLMTVPAPTLPPAPEVLAAVALSRMPGHPGTYIPLPPMLEQPTWVVALTGHPAVEGLAQPAPATAAPASEAPALSAIEPVFSAPPAPPAPRRARAGRWLVGAAALVALGLVAARPDVRGALLAAETEAAPVLPVNVPAPTIEVRPLPLEEAPEAVEPSELELAQREAHALVERGKRLLGAGSDSHTLVDARRLFERARQSDAQNPHAHAGLAEVMLRAGEAEEAFSHAAEAVRLRPRRARYRVLLGDIFQALGRSDEAREAYARAAELDPQGRHIDGDQAASLRSSSAL